ncbi:hypothetical protein Btru_047605 [Bulinus truncatus]|nr:hypothetical protein Btru_047605 [Bulinus truncatus]
MAAYRKLFSLVVALLTTGLTGKYVAASRLQFRANPFTVQPMLTNTLTLRCAIQLDSTFQSRQIHGNLGGDTLQTEAPSYTSAETPPMSDVDHIMSIIISKLNPQSLTSEPVANVTPYDEPAAEGPYVNHVQIEGNTESSPVAGERGFLEVTWFQPIDGGTYSCDVTALTTDRHPTSLSKTLELEQENQLLRQELDSLKVNVSSDDGNYSRLRSDLDNLTSNLTNQTSELVTRVNGLKGQNIQTGFDVCKGQLRERSLRLASTSRAVITLDEGAIGDFVWLAIFVKRPTVLETVFPLFFYGTVGSNLYECVRLHDDKYSDHRLDHLLPALLYRFNNNAAAHCCGFPTPRSLRTEGVPVALTHHQQSQQPDRGQRDPSPASPSSTAVGKGLLHGHRVRVEDSVRDVNNSQATRLHLQLTWDNPVIDQAGSFTCASCTLPEHGEATPCTCPPPSGSTPQRPSSLTW